MEKIIIASGEGYTDIDTLACAVSYANLLLTKGKSVNVILPGPFNKSITDEIRSWEFDYLTKYVGSDDDEFIIVDLSDPKYIAKLVDQNKIIGIFDHHCGFEKFWTDRLGRQARIERVGACATLIVEEYEKQSDIISTINANLLYAAIISNTLNLSSSVTSRRDYNALSILKKITDLPNNWTEKYFNDQAELTYKNPTKSVREDTKIVEFANLGNKITIGQIELWNSREFVNNFNKKITETLKSFGEDNWFLTSPSISEKRNYIITDCPRVRDWLNRVLGVNFVGNLGITSKLWLRKEIIEKILEL